jgi:hypothetical protein
MAQVTFKNAVIEIPPNAIKSRRSRKNAYAANSSISAGSM